MSGFQFFYGGRFQPPHKGHNEVFDIANSTFYINGTLRLVSSDVEGKNSPFSFDDKQLIWWKMFDRMLEYSSDPAFNPKELRNPERPLSIVFGNKDSSRYNSKHFVQLSLDALITPDLSKIYTIGVNMRATPDISGTEVRKNIKYNKDYFIKTYGRFDKEIYDLINERLS